jgi:hypothetical protein
MASMGVSLVIPESLLKSKETEYEGVRTGMFRASGNSATALLLMNIAAWV